MRILVVTGMSGAGKSTALRALEDIGYYCVDNLPLPLLGQFVSLLAQTAQPGQQRKAALGIDARGGQFLAGFREAMDELRAAKHSLEVLFLDASDETLVRRGRMLLREASAAALAQAGYESDPRLRGAARRIIDSGAAP